MHNNNNSGMPYHSSAQTMQIIIVVNCFCMVCAHYRIVNYLVLRILHQ